MKCQFKKTAWLAGAAKVVTCAVLVFMTTSHASAAIFTWTGGGINDLWTNPANYGGTAPDPAGDDIIFDGNTQLTNTNDFVVAAPADRLRLNQLTFANTLGGPVVINGNPFGVDALSGSAPRSIHQNSNFGVTVNALLVQEDRALKFTGTGTGKVNFAGGIQSDSVGNNPTSTLLITTDGDQFGISGVISGPKRLEKKGTGSLTLSGDNSGFSGGVTIAEGTVVALHNNALGTGPISVKGELRLGDGVSIVTTAADLKDNMTFSTPGAASIDATWSTTGGQRRAINVTEGIITTTGDFSGNARKKTGAGTWIFASTTSHNKGYDVEEGTFLINGAFTNGSKEHTVFDTATIGGSGSTAKDVILQEGGSIAPGNSIGTFTISGSGNLILESGAILDFEAALVSDLVAVLGDVTFEGDLDILVDDYDGTFVNGEDLVLISGYDEWDISNLGTVDVSLPAGATFDNFIVDDDSARLTNLVFASATDPVVPEPASIAIWSIFGICLAGYGYRRRRSS